MLKKILSCLREYKLPTVLTLIFILAEAGIEALLPFITAKLVKDVQESAPMNDILRIGIILTILAIISMMCGATAGFTASKASTGLSINLRHDMFEKIQTYAFENIDKFSSSSLVTRMTTDITNLQMAFMMIIRMGLRSPLMFVFSVIMAFVMGGKLAMAFVIVIPVLVIGLFLVSKYAMPAFRSVFKKYDRLNESIEENVRAMRVVKGFSREEHEKKKFGISADDICKDFTKAERIVALNTPLMQICLYFDMVFILFVGSKMAIIDNAVDIGQISAMITYGVQILMALMFLSVIYVMVTMSAESTKRIYEVLVEEPSLQNPEQALKIITDGDIEFENVNFKYSAQAKKYALANINLHIASGQTVGIIGGTGSSKSTLVQLIPRLYDVTEGSVKIGGVDVRNYDIDVLRNAVAMVLQKNVLFSGTIKENLRWGNPNATDEEMIEA